MNNLYTLLAVTLILFYTTSGFNDGPIPLEKVRISMKNSMFPPTMVKIHCKSVDVDDPGTHAILPGQTYTFEFQVNSALTKIYFCHFEWPALTGGLASKWFDIYGSSNMDIGDCDTCAWLVQRDALCRLTPEKKEKVCLPYNLSPPVAGFA